MVYHSKKVEGECLHSSMSFKTTLDMQSITMLLCQHNLCSDLCAVVLGAGETGEGVPNCRGSYRHNHDIILCLHSGKALNGIIIH